MWPYGSEQEDDPYIDDDDRFAEEIARERFLPPTDEEVDRELERRKLDNDKGD